MMPEAGGRGTASDPGFPVKGEPGVRGEEKVGKGDPTPCHAEWGAPASSTGTSCRLVW